MKTSNELVYVCVKMMNENKIKEKSLISTTSNASEITE